MKRASKINKFGVVFVLSAFVSGSVFAAIPNGQLRKIGREAGKKAVNNIPLTTVTVDPYTTDFPLGGIQGLTPEQVEVYRSGFTEGQQKLLAGHVGWKWGLAAATPTTPALGYTKPAYGELLKNEIIVGDNVNIDPNYAISPVTEADMLFVVKSGDINDAVTLQDILANVRGVYPAVELAAAYVPRRASGEPHPIIPRDFFGPVPFLGAVGDGVFPAVNAAARLFVRASNMIPIPGPTRSLADWEVVLNGGLVASDALVKGSGNASAAAGPVPHLTNLKNMIAALKAQGIKLRKGDIVSPGTAVAVRFMDGTQQQFTATYGNLDPNQTVQLQINFVPGGLTQKPADDGHDESEYEQGEDND